MRRGLLVAIGGWAAVVVLAARGAAANPDPLSLGSLLLCLLLVLAPTSLALPAGRTLGAPGWAIETIVAWASLGYLLCYVDPRSLGRGPALALLAPALTVALASPALPLAALLPSLDPRHLRRQGYILASGLCGLLLLQAIGVLNPLTLLPLALLVLIGQALLRVGGGAATGRTLRPAPHVGAVPMPAPIEAAAPAVGHALAIGSPGSSGD